MNPEELRALFAEAREARGQIPDEELNKLIVQFTKGQARNMASLAQLVGEQSEQVLPEEEPSLGKFPGAVQAFGQGLTFNLLDEAIGLVSPEEGERVQRQSRQFQEEHPILSAGGEIAGAIVPGILGGVGAARALPAAANAFTRTTARRLGTGALIGGAEGALSEAGRAETGERLRAAATGGAFGAVGGAIGAGVVTPLLSVAGSQIARRLPGAANRRAGRLVGNILEEQGGSAEIDRLAAQARRVGGETGDEVRVFDLVGPKLGQAAELDPVALRQATDAIERRSARAPSRIKQQTELALGVEDSAEELRQLARTQRAATRQAYNELSADQQMIPNTELIEDLLERPSGKRAFNTAAKARADNGLAPLPEGQMDFDAMQDVKLALDDQVTRAYKSGTPNAARGVRELRDSWVVQMNNTFENFAPTQAQFAGAAQIDEALEQGRRIASKSLQEVDDDLLRIADDPVLMRAYRSGAAEGVGERVSRRENPVKIFNEELRDKIERLAPEGADVGRLGDALDLEARLARAKVPEEAASLPFVEQVIADRPGSRFLDPSGRTRPGVGGGVPRVLGLLGGLNQQGALARAAGGAATPAQATVRGVTGQLGERLTAPGTISNIARRRAQGLLGNIVGRTGIPAVTGGLLGGQTGNP